MARPNAYQALELELKRAMAESLGRAGERLERAITRYTELTAELRDAPEETRRTRLSAARAEMIQAREWLIIQREAIGLRRHDVVDEKFPLKLAGL